MSLTFPQDPPPMPVLTAQSRRAALPRVHPRPSVSSPRRGGVADAVVPAAGDKGEWTLKKRHEKRRVEEGTRPSAVATDWSLELVVNASVLTAVSTEREQPVMWPGRGRSTCGRRSLSTCSRIVSGSTSCPRRRLEDNQSGILLASTALHS